MGKTIYTGEGKTLLARGVILTEYFIRKLRNIGLSTFYIENENFKDIILEDILSEKVKLEAMQNINTLNNWIRNSQNNLSATALKPIPIDERMIKKSAADIVDEILKQQKAVHSLIEMRSKEEWLVAHSIQVAVISVILGQKLNLNRIQLEDLAIGALFHDIGMSFLPLELINKPPAHYSPEEMKVYQNHTTEGFNFLRKNLEISLLSAHIAYQHHEIPCGGGFPRKIKGDEIIQYAKIVRVADVYDELASGIFGASPLLPHEAFEIIVSLAGKTMDFEIIEAFSQHVAAYPNGSSVLLNNGQTGVVIAQNGLPTRPKVRVLWDQGETIKVVEHDLCKELTLFITKVVL